MPPPPAPPARAKDPAHVGTCPGCGGDGRIHSDRGRHRTRDESADGARPRHPRLGERVHDRCLICGGAGTLPATVTVDRGDWLRLVASIHALGHSLEDDFICALKDIGWGWTRVLTHLRRCGPGPDPNGEYAQMHLRQEPARSESENDG